MRWIVFVLWFLLTLIWIGYSSSTGSGPRVAVIPPALALIALMFTWLWKRLVVRIAGESEPLNFHPYWGSALPLRGTLHISLVTVGVFAGAVVGQSIFDTAVFNRSATRPADQANLPEPKAVSTIIVRTEPVKSPVQPTLSDQVQDLTELNELKAKILGGRSSAAKLCCRSASLQRTERHEFLFLSAESSPQSARLSPLTRQFGHAGSV